MYVVANGNVEFVEHTQGTSCDVPVPTGKGVERPREDSVTFHSDSIKKGVARKTKPSYHTQKYMFFSSKKN